MHGQEAYFGQTDTQTNRQTLYYRFDLLSYRSCLSHISRFPVLERRLYEYYFTPILIVAQNQNFFYFQQLVALYFLIPNRLTKTISLFNTCGSCFSKFYTLYLNVSPHLEIYDLSFRYTSVICDKPLSQVPVVAERLTIIQYCSSAIEQLPRLSIHLTTKNYFVLHHFSCPFKKTQQIFVPRLHSLLSGTCNQKWSVLQDKIKILQ